MQIVITTGAHAGRHYSAEHVAAAGYDPTGFLIGLASRGLRWRIEGLDQHPQQVRQEWSMAHLVALVGMALQESRTVRVGAQRWEAAPGRFAEQLQEIEDVIVESGRHVFVLTEPGSPNQPGDLVIGLGDPE